MVIIRFSEADAEKPDDPDLGPDETAVWKFPKKKPDDPDKKVFWKLVKKVKNTTADDWVTLLKKDDPDFDYKVSRRCPT